MLAVSIRFKTLLARIEPLASETRTSQGHYGTVSRRLESTLDLYQAKMIGSYPRGTAIRRFSDLDLLAVFRRDEIRWGSGVKASTTVLGRVRRTLQERYPSTAMRRDQQAIMVGFGGGSASVDVVPAAYWGMHSSRPRYIVPDGHGGWMYTSPEAHGKYVADADARSRGKLKNIAKLLKFWRECRAPRVPLASFHIELLLAREGVCAGPKSYAQCVRDALVTLANRELAALQDPVGISGQVPAVGTEAKRESALKSVLYSATHAAAAVSAEAKDRQMEACRQWNIVFNKAFPA